MDRLIYTAMTGANAAAQRQAVLSNNLANASTNGFRAELSTFRAVPVRGDGASTRVMALVAALAYAGVLIALGQSNLPDLTTVGVTRTVSVLAILPAFLLVRELPKRTNVYPILWCGLLDAVGFAFFAFAASIGPLSVASVTATQWGTAAALIGIIGMRERLFTNQYIGIAVTLLAVTGLGLLS